MVSGVRVAPMASLTQRGPVCLLDPNMVSGGVFGGK
jgi:hypothetical protein